MSKSIEERLDELEKRVSTEEWVESLERRVANIERKKLEKADANTVEYSRNPIIFISILCAIGSIACTILVFLLKMR